MFDDWTKRAKLVMALAHGEAVRLRHEKIGVEHFLLAVPDAGGAGAAILRELGISRERLRAAIEHQVPPGEAEPQTGQKLFDPELVRVLNGAGDAAQDGAVGTHTLLIGVILTALPTSPTRRALVKLGGTHASALQEAMMRLSSADMDEPETR